MSRRRILVMDNDYMMRHSLSELLYRIGHDVWLAGNGPEAVEMFARSSSNGCPFDLVILGTTDKGCSDWEAIAKLKEIDPQVRAVISTNYADDETLRYYSHYGFHGVIPKPFTIDDLKNALSLTLGEIN